MAKKQDKDLMQMLRESGLRKKVARDVTESAGRANQGKQPKTVTQTVESLRAPPRNSKTDPPAHVEALRPESRRNTQARSC